MNKHFAVVKRTKKILTPVYREDEFSMTSNETLIPDYKIPEIKMDSNGDSIEYTQSINKIQKFNLSEVNYLISEFAKYKRAIVNIVSENVEVVFWKGQINQLPIEVNEKLNINGEVHDILEVIKFPDGRVEYWIDSFYEVHKDYDELYSKCLVEFEAFDDPSVQKAMQEFIDNHDLPKFKKKLKWYQKLLQFIRNEED